jgi:hypothetical protein
MLAGEARRAVEESLAQGSRTPCTWRSDRDRYVAEESEKLLAALIDPVRVSVGARTHDYDGKGLSEYENAFAVAHHEESWLLFLPVTEHFARALGKRPAELSALGFSSKDALAEWLG